MVQGGGFARGANGSERPSVVWAMSCDYVMIDNSGRFSIIGVFEGATMAQFPSAIPQFFVISMWSGPASATFTTETWLWSPDNEVIERTPPFPSQFSNFGKGLIINRFLNVAFPKPGVYHLELIVDGQGAFQLPLVIQEHQHDHA